MHRFGLAGPKALLINFHVRSFRVELPNVISPVPFYSLRRNQVASVAQRTRNKRNQISIRRVSKEMNSEKAGDAPVTDPEIVQ